MNALELHPLDTLFFRDARPMETGAGSGGHGANWPLPTVTHEALRTALLRLAGELRTGKERRGHDGASIITEAFRSLHTRGPFPCKDGVVHLPCPADAVQDENGKTHLMTPIGAAGASDLPPGLRPVAPPVRVGKQKLPQWLPLEEFAKALKGEAPCLAKTDLYDTEYRIGIGIDDATGTVEKGKFYSSEHLRLRPEVSLWLEAALSDRKEGENRGKSLDSLKGQTFGLGGEGRMVRPSDSTVKLTLPEPRGRRIKWVLVTHAVFKGGWRPAWIRESDLRVLIAKGETDRRPGEARGVWRARLKQMAEQSQFIAAKLIAVRNEKPVYFSGWDLGEQGAKPTLAAMPAGSVFYFEAATDADAQALVKALHGRTRSDYFGEKGMGLGFCGTW